MESDSVVRQVERPRPVPEFHEAFDVEVRAVLIRFGIYREPRSLQYSHARKPRFGPAAKQLLDRISELFGKSFASLREIDCKHDDRGGRDRRARRLLQTRSRPHEMHPTLRDSRERIPASAVRTCRQFDLIRMT